MSTGSFPFKTAVLAIMVLPVIVTGLLFGGCGSADTDKPRVIPVNDFESDADLDALFWKCHTLFFLSDEHVTSGRFSLKAEFYPSMYPGVAFQHYPKDWRGYSALCFDVFSPALTDLFLVIRLDDNHSNESYDGRFNQRLRIKPGANSIHIPLDAIVRSGNGEQLDLANIETVVIFMVRPTLKQTLYFDHVRLVSR